MQLKDFPNALEHWRQAIKNTELPSEKSFLSDRLRECETALASGPP
jgi:hypothetical protein